MSTTYAAHALQSLMNIDTVVEGLISLAEDDWVALWMICCDAEDELGADDADSILEFTLAIVRQLLKRGLIAGDSPVHGVHFNPWRVQDPEVITDFIRRDWLRRGGFPEWGDGPWFAHLRFCRPLNAAA